MNLLSEHLLQQLSGLAGHNLQNSQVHVVGGGSINQVFFIQTPNGSAYCCKLNSATKFPHLFRCEAAGLKQLSAHIQTPNVLGILETNNMQALLMEWIATARPTPLFWRRFGEGMAALHKVTGYQFGSPENNYMGAVPQQNEPLPHWSRFLAERRLLPLARQCVTAKLMGATEMEQTERLCGRLDEFFEPVPPSLVHGDLWSGNFLCNSEQQPVLIDPAVYYGHPSVDLGMTTLFGGFDPGFYEAYQYHAPFPHNHREQWDICNLYPLFIHLYLFGAGYLAQVRRILLRYAS